MKKKIKKRENSVRSYLFVGAMAALKVIMSVGLSVCRSATSFMEVLYCCKCINVVTVVVVYNIINF